MVMTNDNSNPFNILIVDDNPKNIQVIGNILRDAGYLIGYATDGESPIPSRKVERLRFDIT